MLVLFFLNYSLLYIWRQGLLLNLEPQHLARLTDQQVPKILVSPPSLQEYSQVLSTSDSDLR